jgi:hypothetical protein
MHQWNDLPHPQKFCILGKFMFMPGGPGGVLGRLFGEDRFTKMRIEVPHDIQALEISFELSNTICQTCRQKDDAVTIGPKRYESIPHTCTHPYSLDAEEWAVSTVD